MFFSCLSEIGSKRKLSFGRQLLSNSVCARKTLFVTQCTKFKAKVSITVAIISVPFVGLFSTFAQRRIKHLTRRYCKNLDIELVFVPYKIKNLLSAKDAIFKLSRSRVVYKFSCAGDGNCYVGETNRPLATRVREHLTSDKNSHIFQHIHGSETCRTLCSENCFSIFDTASTSFQLKIKEALHIVWENPSLNKQVNHVNLTLSFF